jgi:hypothetical protein
LGELAADDAEKELPRLDAEFTRKDRVSPLIEMGGHSARSFMIAAKAIY